MPATANLPRLKLNFVTCDGLPAADLRVLSIHDRRSPKRLQSNRSSAFLLRCSWLRLGFTLSFFLERFRYLKVSMLVPSRCLHVCSVVLNSGQNVGKVLVRDIHAPQFTLPSLPQVLPHLDKILHSFGRGQSLTLHFTLLPGVPVDPFDTGFVKPGDILSNGLQVFISEGAVGLCHARKGRIFALYSPYGRGPEIVEPTPFALDESIQQDV